MMFSVAECGEPPSTANPNISPAHPIGRERRAVCTKGRDVINAI